MTGTSAEGKMLELQGGNAMKRKIVSMLGIIAMLTGLSACSGATSGDGAETETTPSAVKSNDSAKVEKKHQQEAEAKLQTAKDKLSTKLNDARSLLDSSADSVADQATRDTLSRTIDEDSSMSPDDPQEYESAVNTLQADMDSVTASVDQKKKNDATADQARADANTQQDRQVQQQDVYYANCTAVRAAGKAPLYTGQPGYSSKLDRDGDGVACE